MNDTIPRILVVDDNRMNLRAIRESLEEQGYQVSEAGDGQEAIARVRDAAPDLILLDLVMPKLNGIEVCRILKAQDRFRLIPVILLTARDRIESKVEGLEFGADDYLIKPIDPLELAARVKSMLRLKSLQDELVRANRKLKDMNERLQELSVTDALTALHNRLYFRRRIGHEFERADRYRSHLSCAMADIDHFKQVNDTYGHAAGDAVLTDLGVIFKEALRRIDLAARYGGEEFVFLLPETDEDEALLVGERIREAVERHRFEHEGELIELTISVGIATFPHKAIESEERLIDCADQALYRAKRNGRNRVEQFG